MATMDLQGLFDNLKQMRGATAKGLSANDVVSEAFKYINSIKEAINSLDKTLDTKFKTIEKALDAGSNPEIQNQIQLLLKAKVLENDIEKERNSRMMDMAERLIPQVTKEQLKATREQQLAYRKHKKHLDDSLEIEKKKAEIQKELAEKTAESQIAVAQKQLDAKKFELQDKYGTIQGAFGGFEAKAQDTLTKFLTQGISRYIKEKKEAPEAKAAQDIFDAEKKKQTDIATESKAKTDKKLATRSEDIRERYAIKAAQKNIVDPGSAAKLYEQRNAAVKDIARFGADVESRLLRTRPDENNTAKKNPTTKPPNKDLGGASAPVITPTDITPGKPPAGAKLRRTKTQKKTMVSPAIRRETPQALVTKPIGPLVGKEAGIAKTTGAFGSKGGFVNAGAIADVAGSLRGIANSATKFLGPWGLVASALMSVDRTMPLISDGMGAITDLTKMVMPLLVSSIIEGFAQLLAVGNGIIDVFDKSTFGPGKIKNWDEAIMKAQSDEALRQTELKKAQENIANGNVAIDLNSARRGASFGRAAVLRQDELYTTPTDANTIMSSSAPTTMQQETKARDALQEQREQTKAMQEAVITAAKTPGTTPIMVANPYLEPWLA